MVDRVLLLNSTSDLTMNRRKPTKMLLISSALLLCMLQPATAMEETETVKRFVDAFNQKNVEAMLNLSAENMTWMSLSGQALSIETSSQEELKTGMLGYFESIPSARSKIRELNQSGSFVYALEEAFWSVDGAEKSQCSMAVYEFVDSKIQHVWYFPAHKCS